ncbi:hypothetical protein [Candidatus Ruminimicrobium bovinum]|uniref:hypothetical protein n=1 Tax=Candidatus Ruminimicrobium bovinum TaxID=3242779 RepID=UPI0039B83D33
MRYHSELIHKLCEEIGFPASSDSLAVGDTIVGELFRMPVHVRLDSSRMVRHVGFRLFHPQVSKLVDERVCDFLERYFLELYLWKESPVQQRIADDGVSFEAGFFYDIERVSSEMPFTLDRQGDKSYLARWESDGETMLAVRFPISFELLTGMPLIEIEQTIFQDVLSTPLDTSAFVLAKEMIEVDDDVFAPVDSRFYYLPVVNDRMYCRKTKKGFEPIFERDQPVYSAANLFQIPHLRDYTLHVRQRLYGFKYTEYRIPLSLWVNFCQSQKMNCYFAVEDEYEDGSLLVLVIEEDKNLGCNHLLSVLVPAGFVDEDVELQVKMNVYIPTHSLKDLYQEKHSTPQIHNIP